MTEKVIWIKLICASCRHWIDVHPGSIGWCTRCEQAMVDAATLEETE